MPCPTPIRWEDSSTDEPRLPPAVGLSSSAKREAPSGPFGLNHLVLVRLLNPDSKWKFGLTANLSELVALKRPSRRL
jgi:hypothetical protein